jgi:hypothetical protein
LLDAVPHTAVGLVLALALLVLHHAFFARERLGGDLPGEKTHAVGFEIERAVERGGGHVLEEVGAIRAGGSIAVVGAEVVHRLTESVRIVFATVEEEVLEEVREAGLTAALVARAHVIPEVHAHDWRVVIFVYQEREAVRQNEFLVRNAIRSRSISCANKPAAKASKQQERTMAPVYQRRDLT